MYISGKDPETGRRGCFPRLLRPQAGLKICTLLFQVPAPAQPGRPGVSNFPNHGPCQTYRRCPAFPPYPGSCSATNFFNQPPVTVRDTSIENLRNQGHTGRKPPSQPSNQAGHLAADWARSAGHRRGTTRPQNPQRPQGSAGSSPWLPGRVPTPTPQEAQPSHGPGGSKQEKGPERKSCDKP